MFLLFKGGSTDLDVINGKVSERRLELLLKLAPLCLLFSSWKKITELLTFIMIIFTILHLDLSLKKHYFP